MKKSISMLLLLALCVSLASPAFAAGFTDVKPDDYCYAPVLWAVENGITSGTTAVTFSPEKTCTVGEILTFLWRAEREPTPMTGGEIPFTNVTGQEYYANPACWAYGAGLISGTTFPADTPCTRSMAMVYLWKLSGSPAASGSTFTDVPANAEYASAVAWAVEKGITSGTSATTFSPDKTCTRGQIATFLYRYAGSPAVTRPTTFYAQYPEVPDFGVSFGIPLTDTYVDESGNYAYCYSIADTLAVSSDGTVILDYEETLKKNGFTFVTTLDKTETTGTTMDVFASKNYVVSFGILKSTYVAVLVQAIPAEGEYYTECPDVPNFGAVAGLHPTEKSQRPDGGWFYSYDGSTVTEEHLKAYMEKLIAVGFQGASYDANGYGAEFITFVKGGTTVMFGVMYGGAAVSVAVYYY